MKINIKFCEDEYLRRMKCTVFCCERFNDFRCCYYCKHKYECPDRCLNTPQKCKLFKNEEANND